MTLIFHFPFTFVFFISPSDDGYGNSNQVLCCCRRIPRHVALQLFHIFTVGGHHAFADPWRRQMEVDPVGTIFFQLRAEQQQQRPRRFIQYLPIQNVPCKLRLFFQNPYKLHRGKILPAVARRCEFRTNPQEFRPDRPPLLFPLEVKLLLLRSLSRLFRRFATFALHESDLIRTQFRLLDDQSGMVIRSRMPSA